MCYFYQDSRKISKRTGSPCIWCSGLDSSKRTGNILYVCAFVGRMKDTLDGASVGSNGYQGTHSHKSDI
jgi:hypothetical protein